MRYTDHSRLAIYGNVNNLNDSRKPGENDSWSPSDLQGGLSEQQLGGVDYFIDDRNGKYTLDGNVQVNHRRPLALLIPIDKTSFLVVILMSVWLIATETMN